MGGDIGDSGLAVGVGVAAREELVNVAAGRLVAELEISVVVAGGRGVFVEVGMGELSGGIAFI